LLGLHLSWRTVCDGRISHDVLEQFNYQRIATLEQIWFFSLSVVRSFFLSSSKLLKLHCLYKRHFGKILSSLLQNKFLCFQIAIYRLNGGGQGRQEEGEKKNEINY